MLVVDDDAEQRASSSELLRTYGHVVACASNGEEALAVLARVRPDLVLLDLRMPVMDGRAFLRAVAADRSLSTIPVIIVTGEPTAPRGYAVVAKPAHPSELLALIAEHCAAPSIAGFARRRTSED